MLFMPCSLPRPRALLLPFLLLSSTLHAQQDQDLIGNWEMTRMDVPRPFFKRTIMQLADCPRCEVITFNPDHTYAWHNAALNITGKWRLHTWSEGEPAVMLYERRMNGEAMDGEEDHLFNFEDGELLLRGPSRRWFRRAAVSTDW